MKSPSGKKGPLICLICSSSHTQKWHLKIHIKSVHENLKPYICPDCEYRSFDKGTMKIHPSALQFVTRRI